MGIKGEIDRICAYRGYPHPVQQSLGAKGIDTGPRPNVECQFYNGTAPSQHPGGEQKGKER